ncbi:hypothetical protein IQ238_27780 [Pleurocapsales cyanobacterium LEGE 06147]|nr:hypothetical protein [Pleurocapsales cyanobacterium LEGE 06147]
MIAETDRRGNKEETFYNFAGRVFNGGDSNLYRYVFNAPTNYNDPTGKLAPALVIPAIGIGILGIGLLYEFNRQLNQLPDKIDSLPPEWFEPNNLNQPEHINQIQDYQEQLIPPKVDEGTKPFDNQQQINKDNHTAPHSCPAGDFSNPYFKSSNNNFDNFLLPNPNHDPDYVNLKKQLASEEQLGESGLTIAGPGSGGGVRAISF